MAGAGTLRRIANLVLAVAQAVLPALLFQGGEFGPDSAVGQLSSGPTPAEPAGYAFIIWAPIFLGCIAYGIYQALPRQAEDPVLRRIGWLTAGGFFLTCLWLLAAKYGPLWATVPIIAGMLACIGPAFLTAARWPEPLGLVRHAVVMLPLGLFAGWLSAAVFVNAAEVLPNYGFDRFGLSVQAFSLLAVVAAAALALAILHASRGSLPYALAVLWALAGIVAANLSRDLSTTVAWTAAGAALVLATALVAIRRSSGHSLRHQQRIA